MAYYRTGTNDFSALQYTNLIAGNIKNNITVTVKDPNDITLKSVTGNYTGPTFSVNGSGCQEEENGYNRVRLIVSGIKNVKSMTFYVYDTNPGIGQYNAQFTLNGNVVGTKYDNGSYTINNIPDNSTIQVLSGWHSYGYGRGFEYQYLQISSFVAR